LSASVSLTGCGTVQRQRRITVLGRLAGLLTQGSHQGLHPDYFPGQRTHGPAGSLILFNGADLWHFV